MGLCCRAGYTDGTHTQLTSASQPSHSVNAHTVCHFVSAGFLFLLICAATLVAAVSWLCKHGGKFSFLFPFILLSCKFSVFASVTHTQPTVYSITVTFDLFYGPFIPCICLFLFLVLLFLISAVPFTKCFDRNVLIIR